MINEDEVIARRRVWESAAELVALIIDQHGLTEYKVGVSPFVLGSTNTLVDQHIDQIVRVACWLINEET